MSKPTPQELLAAYASGGLDDSERARVDAYLAENPEARTELEALREVIGEVRTIEPGPAPHLGTLRASISAALDEVDRERDEGGLWRFLRPLRSPLWAGAVVAAAALLVLLVIRGGDEDASEPGSGSVAAVEPAAPAPAAATEDPFASEELFAAEGDELQELEMLPGEELDAVDEEIFAALEELGDDGDDGNDGSDTGKQAGNDWGEAIPSEADLAWIDDLSAEDLALLDEALSELEAS